MNIASHRILFKHVKFWIICMLIELETNLREKLQKNYEEKLLKKQKVIGTMRKCEISVIEFDSNK